MELHSSDTANTAPLDMDSKSHAEAAPNALNEASIQNLLDNALEQGIQGHSNGHLEIAEEVFEAIIQMKPSHAHANHRMGLLKIDKGTALEALPYLENAIMADPSVLTFWVSLSETLIDLEQFEEATKIINLARETGVDGDEFTILEKQLDH